MDVKQFKGSIAVNMGEIFTILKRNVMRLDNDILLYLKKIASERKIGYQTLINSVLREFIKKAK